MSRPISGNQLDKLGKRLAQPGPISNDDYQLLAQVAEFYQAVTDKVQGRLQRLGFEPTTRGFKSTGTIVDKLRRTRLKLKDIQDLAGARIVVSGGRLDQDRAAGRIMQEFEDCPKPPLMIDRREKPSSGYRAVHIVVYEDSTPMEIQVRTSLQDAWAQISEKLGDIWGRGLRYGTGPDLPDSPVVLGGPPMTRREVIGILLRLSDAIDRNETSEVGLTDFREQMLELNVADRGNLTESIEGMTRDVARTKEDLQDVLDRLLAGIRQLEGTS